MFAKFDEIPSIILHDIKETKRYGNTVGRSFGQTDGQRENSIPSHKHSLQGGIITGCSHQNYQVFLYCWFMNALSRHLLMQSIGRLSSKWYK